MTIVRRNYGRGHGYTVDGEKLPGVTTIISATLPKTALINWAGETTAGYAIDHWDDLAKLAPSKRLKELNRARFEEKDTAANRGTEVHRLGAKLVAGEKVDVPDELAGHVESYVAFLNDFEPQPIAVEVVGANRSIRYCGTGDLFCEINGVLWCLDLKTSRTGIFGETALQCTGYKHFETFLGDDGEEHEMAELGEIERVGAVHIRADGYDLRSLRHDDEVWQTFRHLRWLYARVEDIRDWVGPAIQPARVA